MLACYVRINTDVCMSCWSHPICVTSGSHIGIQLGMHKEFFVSRLPSTQTGFDRHLWLWGKDHCDAGVRNVRVKTSSAQYVGIWHAEVLSLALEEGYPGTGHAKSSLRLLIGEPGPAGFTSDIQVPCVPGYESVFYNGPPMST